MNEDHSLALARQQLDLVRQTASAVEVLLNNFERVQADQKQLRSDQRQIAGKVARLEDESNMAGRHWTVAAWVSYHGHSASIDALKEEGGILRGLCMTHGFAVPEGKVCNGSRFPARQWPIEAIRLWWPGCCDRHGWKLTWKV